VALLPVDKSTIFRSEVSVSCKLIADGGILLLNANLCYFMSLIRIVKTSSD
jgi:hypothetical protein